MSSGGIFGKGISASQQKWGALPEAHTDFIFAVLGEELGLVGTLLVIAPTAWLLTRPPKGVDPESGCPSPERERRVDVPPVAHAPGSDEPAEPASLRP